MSKKHEPATVEVLQCMCYGEGITVEAWEDDEQIFLAMWERAHSEPLSFR